jgi:hypothetical protein
MPVYIHLGRHGSGPTGQRGAGPGIDVQRVDAIVKLQGRPIAFEVLPQQRVPGGALEQAGADGVESREDAGERLQAQPDFVAQGKSLRDQALSGLGTLFLETRHQVLVMQPRKSRVGRQHQRTEAQQYLPLQTEES